MLVHLANMFDSNERTNYVIFLAIYFQSFCSENMPRQLAETLADTLQKKLNLTETGGAAATECLWQTNVIYSCQYHNVTLVRLVEFDIFSLCLCSLPL